MDASLASRRCLNKPAAELTNAFLEAVLARDPAKVQTEYAEAMRSLLVCQAAQVSAKEGRPVTLAELETAMTGS